MDESGARLVHGGAQQYRDLEPVAHRDCTQRALFWRIQSSDVHGMLALVFADRGAVYERIEIGH